MKSNFHIIPYAPEYEPALLNLEKKAVQGALIQLEMVRDHFLSRSVIFENYKIILGITNTGELAGAAAAAIVPVKCRDVLSKVGVGYDLKVAPRFRKQGLSKQFGKYLVEEYLRPEGIKDFMLTMKTNNLPVAKSTFIIKQKWYHYEFIYLTIPTWQRLKKNKHALDKQKLKTRLFENNETIANYFSTTSEGLGIWKTCNMYKIKLSKLHPLIKVGQKLGAVFSPRLRRSPQEGDLLQFATLFNYDYSNFHQLNTVLEQLQEENIQYLNVCCQKGDFVWKALKSLAINAFPYTLMSTFETSPENKIELDVRCL